MQGKIKCTNCNNMIPIGAPYCIFCGVKQSAQADLQEGTKKRRKKQLEVPVVKAGTDVMVPVNVVEDHEPETIRQAQEIVMGEEQKEIHADGARQENTEETVSAEESNRPVDNTETGSKKSLSVRMRAKKDEKEYAYRQNHDELTDLFNRSVYDENMKDMDMENVCIIVMDMNELGKVNRMYGKADGDLVLISVAQVLRLVFGNNCYRMQEGEYCVVLSQIHENAVISRIENFRYELRKKEKELRESGKQLDIKVAVGYLYGVSGQDAADVYAKAREYMLEEKKRMKQIYDPNYDGYYNDVKVEHEESRVEIDRENIHKAVIVVLGAVGFLILYYIFLV